MNEDAARDLIIQAARSSADYWIDHAPAELGVEDRVTGAIFSFLVALDGGSLGSDLEGVDLMVVECDDEGRQQRETRVSTMLHEFLYGDDPSLPDRWRRGGARSV